MSAEETAGDLIHAIQDHPAIIKAAITGSHARGAADRFSDLDVLLVASNFEAIRDVRGWLPDSMPALICAFHLSHHRAELVENQLKVLSHLL